MVERHKLFTMNHQGTALVIFILLFLGTCLIGQSLTIPPTQTPNASSITFASSEAAPSYMHKNFRAEFGYGFGLADGADGGCGRVALSYLSSKWGIMARAAIYNGEKGNERRNGWFGNVTPVEKFNDKAILLSYVISNSKLSQTFVSAGPGWVKGSKLTINRNSLEDIGPFPGLAFELGIATTGSTVGFGMSLMGNLNSKVNLLGFVVSVTFGYQE